MKKGILMITATLLIINGCADKKKITTTDGKNSINGISSRSGTEVYRNNGDLNSYGYGSSNNIDPYGSGNYGNSNATYSDGTDSSYVGSTIEKIYFGVDKYDITAEKLPIIHSDAEILRPQIEAGAKIKIEGNCDASGSDEYNYALGLRRARATKDALINEDIEADKIIIVSMGESSPECVEDSSASCYAKNRRVEFKIVQ